MTKGYQTKKGKNGNTGTKKQALKKKATPPKGASRNGDNIGLRGIRQGATQVTNQPFGHKKNGGQSTFPKTLCAMSNRHVSLPRAVGSYTVTKTTSLISTPNRLILIGPMTGRRENYDTGYGWLDAVGVAPRGSGDYPINSDQVQAVSVGTLIFRNDMLQAEGYNRCRMVPAAVSVQVTCPSAISNATGACYIGRARNVLQLCGNTRHWTTLASELTGLCNPRVCPASKLAFRGVKVDAIPYNMTVLSDFEPRGVLKSPGAYTWDIHRNDAVTPTFDGDFCGFAPIFIDNPDNIPLNVLVTIEWRVRFDPSNPASAGHSYHPVSTDSEWNNLIRNMETRQGTGVLDIASAVADNGME